MKPREKEHAEQVAALQAAADTVPFLDGEIAQQTVTDANLTLRHFDPEAFTALGLLGFAVGPHQDEATQQDDEVNLIAQQQVLLLTIILLTALVHDLASVVPEPESKVVLH